MNVFNALESHTMMPTYENNHTGRTITGEFNRFAFDAVHDPAYHDLYRTACDKLTAKHYVADEVGEQYVASLVGRRQPRRGDVTGFYQRLHRKVQSKFWHKWFCKKQKTRRLASSPDGAVLVFYRRSEAGERPIFCGAYPLRAHAHIQVFLSRGSSTCGLLLLRKSEG